MPPKRSKSKERERKRKYRELMSDEKKKIEKEKLKERMRKHREKKVAGKKKETLTSALWAPGLLYGETELYKRNNEIEKNRIREKRLHQTNEEKNAENLEAKIRMRKLRKNYTIEEKAAMNSESKMRMRKLSEKLTDEEKQTKREKNRARMKKSRMEKYYDKNDFDKESSSKNYSDDSGNDEDHSSDIVKRINEKHRENNEKKFLLIKEVSETDKCTCDIDINCTLMQRKVVTLERSTRRI